MTTEQGPNDTDKGKPKHLEKIYPKATLSTTNLTQTAPGANLILHSRNQATNHLSYGTASSYPDWSFKSTQVCQGEHWQFKMTNLSTIPHPIFICNCYSIPHSPLYITPAVNTISQLIKQTLYNLSSKIGFINNHSNNSILSYVQILR
jgi:hypothetical protein